MTKEILSYGCYGGQEATPIDRLGIILGLTETSVSRRLDHTRRGIEAGKNKLIHQLKTIIKVCPHVEHKFKIDKRNPLGYIVGVMIKSFKHKGLENFFHSGSKRGIKPEHANRLGRILDRLNAASEIKDMNYPGSFLHQLSGDKKGLHAVKVSGNWRIYFQFIDGDAYFVDYDDYH